MYAAWDPKCEGKNNFAFNIYRRISQVLSEKLSKFLSCTNLLSLLTHVHSLIICEKDAIRSATDKIKFVSSEIPDEKLALRNLNQKMMQGPYENEPCLKSENTLKTFPKHSRMKKNLSKGMQENSGRFFCWSGKKLDNRFVVALAYNPTLCSLFSAHVNVEVCVTVRAECGFPISRTAKP